METYPQDHSSLLTELVKLRLKKIVEKLLRALSESDNEAQMSLSFSIGKAKLLRLVEEENPHVALKKLIRDLCEELKSFISNETPILELIKLRSRLHLLLKQCGADRLSFTYLQGQTKQAGKEGATLKTMESQRMSQASLISFRKGKRW